MDNMASRFPESLSEAHISEINEKGFIFKKNIILRLNVIREAEMVTLRRACALKYF